ncbi:hypothetical protein COCMIDRAFT_83108 [Bipolaris oryzae ATCC 44560]|uniref:Uncharacterized protein n=1 Tax=Bipolaris oryzae ATCC 44560 TaxID=930090 RepID=W6ZJ57_COCMI|nr:uncharacterized protein COCMIDRAFT_83108 [Bipolaris oryzae ATCC 44560]EUC50048.1 hypothetical protein COCMIDRAFT_83108 [Bipolaris oryzae ATCC 44560]
MKTTLVPCFPLRLVLHIFKGLRRFSWNKLLGHTIVVHMCNIQRSSMAATSCSESSHSIKDIAPFHVTFSLVRTTSSSSSYLLCTLYECIVECSTFGHLADVEGFMSNITDGIAKDIRP